MAAVLDVGMGVWMWCEEGGGCGTGTCCRGFGQGVDGRGFCESFVLC